jgi:hypothetical protein
MVKEGRRPDKTTGRGEAPACYVDEDNNPDGVAENKQQMLCHPVEVYIMCASISRGCAKGL